MYFISHEEKNFCSVEKSHPSLQFDQFPSEAASQPSTHQLNSINNTIYTNFGYKKRIALFQIKTLVMFTFSYSPIIKKYLLTPIFFSTQPRFFFKLSFQYIIYSFIYYNNNKENREIILQPISMNIQNLPFFSFLFFYANRII